MFIPQSRILTLRQVHRSSRLLHQRPYATQTNTQRLVDKLSEHHNDSFLQGSASTYIDTMYTSWKADPTSVHVSWQAYFHKVGNGHVPVEQAFIPAPDLVSPSHTILTPKNATNAQSETVKQLKAIQLIQAYQRWGHEHANIDPLGMLNVGRARKKELSMAHYGLGPEDLDMVIPVALGPEHTSARLERFLQLGDEDSRKFPSTEQLQRQHQDANIQVVCMTSPANYFHVLRRQIHREFRKPLIILFSKSLLRHPLARSDIEEFIETPYFQPLLSETQHGITVNKPEDIKRIIFCSGQVYAALYKYRETHGLKDTAITRIEELHPFPWEQVRQNLDNYPNATDVVWCQEETLNGGAWSYVMPRFEVILAKTENHTDKKIRYAGREPMSSVAVGYKMLHAVEEEKPLGDAFQMSPDE